MSDAVSRDHEGQGHIQALTNHRLASGQSLKVSADPDTEKRVPQRANPYACFVVVSQSAADFVPSSLRWFFVQRGLRFRPFRKVPSANQSAPELAGRVPRLAANESGKRGRIRKTEIARDLGEVSSRVPHPFDGRMQPVIA